MTVVAGDIVRTAVNFELGDGTMYQNVFHHERYGADPVSDAAVLIAIEDWAETMYAELVTLVKDDTIEQLSFVDRVEFIAGLWTVVENIGTFTPTFNPAATGDALPFNCAPFLVFKTDRPKTVGRKFLFPFDEAQQADSILVGGAITAMVAWGVDAVSDILLAGDAGLEPGVPRTGVDAFYAFTVTIVNDVIGSQRRRRPGVGA